MSRKIFLSKALLASAATLFIFALPAYAGFEWKAQQTATPSAAPSGMMPEPPLTWDGVSEGVMPAEKVGEVLAVPVAPPVIETMPATPAIPAVIPAAPLSAAMSSETVDGFGSDMPLVIALQQIVPAGHQFSFGRGVNPGTPVSWQGGKPWNVVLSDTLTEKGLAYSQSGNVLRILRADSAVMTAPPVAGFVTAEMIETAPADTFSAPPAPAMAVPPISLSVEEHHDTAAVASEAASPKPVDIRRQKPTGLIQRMKRMIEKPAPATEASAPAAPVKTETSAAQMSAPPALSDADKYEDTYSAAAPISLAPAPAASMPAMDVAPVPATTPAVTSGISWEPSAPAAATAQATWHGAQGQTLREVLKSWADVAGVELYWSIDYDYRLNEDVGYPGTFDEAVGRVLDRFADVRPQPYGQLHQGDGNGAPRVLVVKSYDLVQ